MLIRRISLVVLVALLLMGCAAPATLTPAPIATPSLLPAPAPTFPAAPTSTKAEASLTPTPATATSRAPHFHSPTPPPNPGTTITAAGQYQTLSHPYFYWTLQLPQDWVITYDRGFEILANNPDQTAFLHLLSQVWGTQKERVPTARDYVNYWKHDKYGDIFPVYAQGTQVSETEISPGKFGGPYLRYEFDDDKKGVRYLQVYASGGGPSSVMLSTWAKSAEFDNVKTILESILASLELLKQP